MTAVAALLLADEAAYREYFHVNYCAAPVVLVAGQSRIPVYFKKKDFDHAFFESSQRNGVKDQFSPQRAIRLPMIAEALNNSDNERFQGWNSKARAIDDTRCVCLVTAEDFVVVVRLGLTDRGDMRGWFVTCYYADSPSSIKQIREKPEWVPANCEQKLREQRERR